MPSSLRKPTWGLLCSLAVVYVGFSFTSAGQRFDNHAKLFSSIHSLPRRLERDGIPSFKLGASAVAALVALIVVAAISVWAQRETLRVVLTAAFIVVPPVAVVEVLKLVLPRPTLHDAPDWLGTSTFPSGHVAFVVASCSFVYLLSTAWRRTVVASAGSVAAFAIMLLVVASGMHRPSDAIGGAIVSLAWVSAAAPFVCTTRDMPVAPSSLWRPLSLLCAAIGIAIVVTTPIAPLLPRSAVVDRAFAGAAMLLIAMAFSYLLLLVRTCDTLMIRWCDSVQLDSRNDATPATSKPSPPIVGGLR